jgi:hypothetical protein
MDIKRSAVYGRVTDNNYTHFSILSQLYFVQCAWLNQRNVTSTQYGMVLKSAHIARHYNGTRCSNTSINVDVRGSGGGHVAMPLRTLMPPIEILTSLEHVFGNPRRHHSYDTRLFQN